MTFDEALEQAKAAVSLQRAHPEEASRSKSTESRVRSKAVHQETPGSEATTAPQHVAKDSVAEVRYQSDGEAALPSCCKSIREPQKAASREYSIGWGPMGGMRLRLRQAAAAALEPAAVDRSLRWVII